MKIQECCSVPVEFVSIVIDKDHILHCVPMDFSETLRYELQHSCPSQGPTGD